MTTSSIINTTQKMKKYGIIIAIGLIVVTAFIAFSPILNSDFVNWDDDVYVTQNPDIKSLSGQNIQKMFSSFYVSNYQPLTMLSYAIEHKFFGLNPGVYHATNLILHLFNCVLVFWIMLLFAESVERRENSVTIATPQSAAAANAGVHNDKSLSAIRYPLPYSLIIAFITALLFAIHPMHVESVAWISERKDVLYTFFFLGSLISYLYYVASPQAISMKWIGVLYWLSLVLFVLSILSKPMAVTLPVILFVIDYFIHRKFDKKNVIEKIPFLVVSIIAGIIAVYAQQTANAISHESHLTFSQNFFINVTVALHGIVLYFMKLLVPINLSCIYPYPLKFDNLWIKIIIFLPVIVFAYIISLKFLKNYRRKINFGFLFFMVTILPVLQFIPLGNEIAADRYTYIPYIGLFYLLSEGVVWANSKFKIQNSKLMNIPILIVLIGIIGILSVLTWQRCRVWNNSITLWTDVIKKYQHISFVYNNRGVAYSNEGEYEKAVADYTQAIKNNPESVDAYVNRGDVHQFNGEYNQSVSDYTQALKLEPNSSATYTNRGYAYFYRGEYDKAIADYSSAINLDPHFTKAYHHRGIVHYVKGEYDKAVSDYGSALKIYPYQSEVYTSLGDVYTAKGEKDKAELNYEQALQIIPVVAVLHYKQGDQYRNMGEYDRAVSEYSQALKIYPNYVKAYNNRGAVYVYKKQFNKAVSDYNQAIWININYGESYTNRGIIFYLKGEYDKAVADYNQALRINPKDSESYNNRAVAYCMKKDYAKAWSDINKSQSLGCQVSPKFLKLLKKESQKK